MSTPLPGETKYTHLLQPVQIGKFTLRNRVKYAACSVSNFNAEDGHITEREFARMEVIAQTGCGLITNQGAYPDPKGEGKAYFRQLAIYNDEYIPGFRRIAKMLHDQGAVAIQQVLHGGRYGGSDEPADSDAPLAGLWVRSLLFAIAAPMVGAWVLGTVAKARRK